MRIQRRNVGKHPRLAAQRSPAESIAKWQAHTGQAPTSNERGLVLQCALASRVQPTTRHVLPGLTRRAGDVLVFAVPSFVNISPR
jgi:hypothetical protein